MLLLKQTNIFWHIALVIKTSIVGMFTQITSDTSLPAEYNGYQLQTVLVSSPRGIGVYENIQGQRVLIKIWRGSVRTYEYYQLVNEIRLYTLLHSVLDRIGPLLKEKYKHVRIPRLLEQEISPTHILSVFEYIDDCIHLKDITPLSKRAEIFNLAFDFWKYVGDRFTAIERSHVPRRTLYGTLFAYGVSLVYAVVRYPRMLPKLMRTLPLVLKALPALASDWGEGLVHRDFHFENVLFSNGATIIIDFGDNAFTSSLQIFTNALHWEWENNESRDIILQSVVAHCGTSKKTATMFRALFAMSAVQLLHDTESKERLAFNFKCFDAVMSEWDDIDAFLIGDNSYKKALYRRKTIKSTLLYFLNKIRSFATRLVRPKSRYPLLPLSTKFGFDRGTPIDRFYIEQFLKKNAAYIQGTCLEIGTNEYTMRFGENRVTKSDVLDKDTKNKSANIHGDIRKLSHISDDTYDCIILTHTLGIIDDHESAAREIVRILKPEGTLLITVSSMGVMQNPEQCFWRYTPTSLVHLFSRYVPSQNIAATSYGNVLAGQAFWVGMAKEELLYEELLYNDPRYAVISAATIKK